ncbi:MAG: alpha/beta fold hydrolase [Bacteroidales bacterium]|nr:alpha/beta fold hydrolase [Bacteroidales bacterium]
MKLAFHKLGAGKPLIILHGLYGSSDNWFSIGRKLSENFEVYLIDQRNHGNSPHSPSHTYETMRDDLYEFINDHHLQPAVLIGHSMGGKTAMSFALKYHERVDTLIVVDISPSGYNNPVHDRQSAIHNNIIRALQLLDPVMIRNRHDADRMLQKSIPQEKIRQFLLKNLKKNKDGKYRWKLNVEALAKNMEHISAGIIEPDQSSYASLSIPALFIKSEFSEYILKEDEDLIHRIFPLARVINIPGTGHWLHAEKPELFLKAILSAV